MAVQTSYDAKSKIWSGSPGTFENSKSIGAVVLESLQSRGDRILQIYDDGETWESMTAAELYRRTVKLANAFRRHGIEAGDVVTFHLQHLPNSTPMTLALFAIGAVVNPLSREHLCNEDRSYVAIAQPKYIVCHVDHLDAVEQHKQKINVSAEVITLEANAGKTRSIEDWLNGDDDDTDFLLPTIDDTKTKLALILASSGTTGKRKLIYLSNAIMMANIIRCTLVKDVGSMFNPSPNDWISGLDNILGSVYRGKTRIICRLPINTERFIEIVRRHNATETFCDPSRMYEVHRLLGDDANALTGVRLLTCGGTIVSEDVQEKIPKCFPNAMVAVCYGMTEMAGVISASILGRRGNSVGFLLHDMEVRVIDGKDESLGPGEVGELLLRSNNPYMWRNEDGDVVARPADTWLHTGDMGYFDADGYLFIVGRKDDQLMYIHHIIAPSDIEAVIEKHEGIRRAAVVGVSVPVLNDMPSALCVRAPDSQVTVDELKEWLDDKLPETHKLRGGIYFVDKLPTTTNGKLRKIVCKEWALRLYHGHDSEIALSESN